MDWQSRLDHNINLLTQCLAIVKRTNGQSPHLQAISMDIDELVTKITTQLSLHFNQLPHPDLEAEFANIVRGDQEHMEFIRDSLPILYLLWNTYNNLQAI